MNRASADIRGSRPGGSSSCRSRLRSPARDPRPYARRTEACSSRVRKVRPQTVRQFFALAAQHTRWQLNDLARRLDQQPTVLPLSVMGLPTAPSTSASMLTPEGRRIWAAIDGLPEEEREIFDLVRVQGLTYAEAAGVVGTSVKTVQRRLTRARLILQPLMPWSSSAPRVTWLTRKFSRRCNRW